MSESFEDVASRELDGLYRGALFLAGGSEQAAEGLLVSTLSSAFSRYDGSEDEGDVGTWLQGRLVLDFLASEAGLQEPDSLEDGDVEVVMRGPRPRSPHLFRASASIPVLARGVLWLVVFRRWPYDAVKRLLGISDDRFREMLEYRHGLIADAMRLGTDQMLPWARAAN